jgi:adenylate cyclase class 2
MMPIEVELKFPLTDDAPTAKQLVERLEAVGARAQPARQQDDHYYDHPGRDFAATDEALRIREDNHQARLTYKGPLIDDVAKSRLEYETAIESADVGASILEALGFQLVRTVSKTRRPFELNWHDTDVEVVIDQVVGLGEFVELETISDENSHQAARDTLLELAGELGLVHSQRQSYLALLLQSDLGTND